MKKMPAMKAILLSSVLALNVSAAFGRDKIVGGEPVTSLAEAPYMVSLSGSCGGSIISAKWVLTAAHCAGYFSSVKAGVLNLKEEGVTFKIKRTIKHPKYNSSTMTHDYALVELEEAIDFKKTKLKAVKLANMKFEQDGNQDEGLDSTVYGFGNLASGRPNSAKGLNKVVVPIVSNETANMPEAYDGQVDETMIAAGYASGGKDSCQGDSGGPMVVFDHQNEPVQVGVVSWGEGCAARNKYGIYSKVSFVADWIKSTIAK
jgi:trypsin